MLKVDTHSHRHRMDHSDRDLSFVPVRDVLVAFNLPCLREPLPDPVPVVLEPVGHQYVLAVGFLDQIFQEIQLPVVDVDDFMVFGVDGAVTQLKQFSAEDSGVLGVNNVFLHSDGVFALCGIAFLLC